MRQFMDMYLSTTEISRHLKISKVTLWKLRKSYKSFPKAKIVGKRKLIFNESEITKWFNDYWEKKNVEMANAE